MEIAAERFQIILDNKLDLNLFYILSEVDKGETIPENTKTKGWITLLKLKGYLDSEAKLTPKGQELVFDVLKNKIPDITEVKDSFESYTEKLLKTLKSKLKEYIGKEQVMGYGNVYFIPGLQDLRVFLTRFNRDYKISLQDNADKIEKILLAHVEKCAKARKYSPAVKYYIIKDGSGSQLAAALENYEELIKEEQKEDFKIINTKDLFE